MSLMKSIKYLSSLSNEDIINKLKEKDELLIENYCIIFLDNRIYEFVTKQINQEFILTLIDNSMLNVFGNYRMFWEYVINNGLLVDVEKGFSSLGKNAIDYIICISFNKENISMLTESQKQQAVEMYPYKSSIVMNTIPNKEFVLKNYKLINFNISTIIESKLFTCDDIISIIIKKNADYDFNDFIFLMTEVIKSNKVNEFVDYLFLFHVDWVINILNIIFNNPTNLKDELLTLLNKDEPADTIVNQLSVRFSKNRYK